MMVSSPCKCPGVEGKVCYHFLLPKENDPHHLCVTCCGKTCKNDIRCEACHDWSDDHCNCVADYMAKL